MTLADTLAQKKLNAQIRRDLKVLAKYGIQMDEHGRVVVYVGTKKDVIVRAPHGVDVALLATMSDQILCTATHTYPQTRDPEVVVKNQGAKVGVESRPALFTIR